MNNDIQAFFARLIQGIPADEQQRIAGVRQQLTKELSQGHLLRRRGAHRLCIRMKDPIAHLFEAPGDIPLPGQRKSQLLRQVIEEAKRRSSPLTPWWRRPPTPVLFGIFRPVRLLASIVLCVMAGGVTLTFASESSLPGDVLYPLKVEIIEPVIATVVLTPKARAAWGVERANRRFMEAWALTTEEGLTDEYVDGLLSHIEEHAQAVNDAASEIEAQGGMAESLKIQSDLEGNLQAHAQALTILARRSEHPAHLRKFSADTRRLEQRAELKRKKLERELVRQTEPPVPLEEVLKEEHALEERAQNLRDELQDLTLVALPIGPTEHMKMVVDQLEEVSEARTGGNLPEAFIQSQEGDRAATELEIILDLTEVLDPITKTDSATTEGDMQESPEHFCDAPTIDPECQ